MWEQLFKLISSSSVILCLNWLIWRFFMIQALKLWCNLSPSTRALHCKASHKFWWIAWRINKCQQLVYWTSVAYLIIRCFFPFPYTQPQHFKIYYLTIFWPYVKKASNSIYWICFSWIVRIQKASARKMVNIWYILASYQAHWLQCSALANCMDLYIFTLFFILLSHWEFR